MAGTNNEQFVEEVKTILSGNITDKDMLEYLAFKIGRLYSDYVGRFLEEFSNAGRDHAITPAEYLARLSGNED